MERPGVSTLSAGRKRLVAVDERQPEQFDSYSGFFARRSGFLGNGWISFISWIGFLGNGQPDSLDGSYPAGPTGGRSSPRSGGDSE